MLCTGLGIYECGGQRKSSDEMASYKISPVFGERSKASQQFRGVVTYDKKYDNKPRRAEEN
jgi:hypothetical protein